VAWFSL